VTPAQIAQLTVIALAAVLAPVIAALCRRWVPVPGVVLELVLGVVIGPQVLDLARPSGLLVDFSGMGLALLMFLAGYELELAAVRGAPLRLAASSWGLSVGLAALVAAALFATGHDHGNSVVTALALTTTALSTLLPIIRDAGILGTDFGRYVFAVGTIGEFGPIVLIAVLLSGKSPIWTLLVLTIFSLLATVSLVAARRPWGRHVVETLRQGLHASSQLPIRASMLLVVTFALAATQLGLDVLLGTFAAGVIVRTTVTGREDTDEARLLKGKLEAIGFGFLIPVFFVVSGMRLRLDLFVQHPSSLLAIPVYLALMLAVRGAPMLLVYRRVFGSAERISLAMLAATGLPLIIVVTTIGADAGYLSAQNAAALVTAGVITVLILPALAVRWPHLSAEIRTARLPRQSGAAPPPIDPRTAEEGEGL
jgi:Kef-type K+ transport system membrane component KefB